MIIYLLLVPVLSSFLPHTHDCTHLSTCALTPFAAKLTLRISGQAGHYFSAVITPSAEVISTV